MTGSQRWPATAWRRLLELVLPALDELGSNARWTLGGGTGLYPAWLADVAIAGFQNIETFSFDMPAPYSHEAWRGRIRASAGVGASLAPDAVAAFDRDLVGLLGSRFAEDPQPVPHRAFCLTARAPG